MTKILAIDSSTEACSVAIIDQQLTYQRYQLAPRKHAELLLPMVDEVLKEASLTLSELDAVACCVGPGAFTGLRIAVSVAQGLAFASNLPCIAVSSLEMLAVNAFKRSNAKICLSAIDARMKEVYFAIFEREAGDVASLVGSECVNNPLDIDLNHYSINKGSDFVCIGSGWSEYEFHTSISDLRARPLDEKYPNAIDMLEVACRAYRENKLLKPDELQPVYIRNNVAKKKSAKK